MTAPRMICVQRLGVVSPGNPCKLSASEVDSGLGDWSYLVNHRPSYPLQQELKFRFPEIDSPYHRIEEASGDVNLDFYPIAIAAWPRVGDMELGPEYIVREMRRGLNRFLDNNGAIFRPYDGNLDEAAWRSDHPEGSVLSISLAYGTQHGSVVCSESTSKHWIFSTVATPGDGDHPVSGNRQFGYGILRSTDSLPEPYGGVAFAQNGDDIPYIYTRGADRCTGIEYSTFSELTFGGGHDLWLSLQRKTLAWIIKMGGMGYVPGHVSKRWDWHDVAVKQGLWRGRP